MSIGNNIRNIRKEKGMTLQQIADAMGCSPQLISQYENGKRIPKMETIQKIADALEVGLWEIIELDQMDLETRIQEIKKMLTQLSSESLEEFIRLLTEALNENQEVIQKEREKAAKKAPKFTDKAEILPQKKPKFFARDKKKTVIEDGKPPKFTTHNTTYAPQEAYELLHSLIDEEGIDDREREEVSQQLKKILGSFKGLNKTGRKKAVERIEELYMIPKYIFDNFPDNID